MLIQGTSAAVQNKKGGARYINSRSCNSMIFTSVKS